MRHGLTFDEWIVLIPILASSLTGSVVAIVTAIKQNHKLDAVHHEVKTTNGLTMAALADRAEGRRIHTDIPAGERTSAEQRYVEHLDDPQSS